MSRPQYKLDTTNVEYTRVGPMTWEFYETMEVFRLLKTQGAVVTGIRRGFRVVSVERLPGPPVDGKHPMRMELELMQ